MRVVLTAGDRSVDIRIDGAGTKALHRVENSALRMLAALPETPKPPEQDEQPFGFGPSAQAERADPPTLREHDIEQYDAPDTRRNSR